MLDNIANIDAALRASAEERERRYAICNSCEKFTELNFCSLCNCFMPVKTWLKNKKCPAGKW